MDKPKGMSDADWRRHQEGVARATRIKAQQVAAEEKLRQARIAKARADHEKALAKEAERQARKEARKAARKR